MLRQTSSRTILIPQVLFTIDPGLLSHYKGGFRIRRRRGSQPSRGRQSTILTNFPKTAWNWENFGSCVLAPPPDSDPPLHWLMIVLGGHLSYWTTFSIIERHCEWRTSALWSGGGSSPSGGELPVHAVCPRGAPQVGARTLHAGVGAHLSRRRVVRPVRTRNARHAVRVLTRRTITCNLNVNIQWWLICAYVIINQ